MGPFEILCIIAGIFLFLYYYSTSTHNFWKNQGVNGPKPAPLFGNFTDLMLNRINLGDYTKKLYEQFINEPMIGMYARRTPILLLKDPELIKDVLIKDFNKFADRGINIHEKVDILSPHLFSLEPKRWRPLRKNLSPVFTSGKLKEMFHLLIETSERLDVYLKNVVVENEPTECRKLTAKFTTDVIGSCAFGIDINALSDDENEFLRMGRKIFDVTFWRTLKMRIRDITPWLYGILGPIVAETEMNNFFVNLIKDTMEYRKKNNVVRHDFVDLLRHVKENPDRLGDLELTDSLIAAQAFVFFIAGFETSSTTMSNALYELALNPSIQDKLRKEIQEELKVTEGKLLYDRIKNLKLLHMVFQETLRKYPPVTVLMRKATEKYTFSGTNVTVPKGQKVWIPAYAIQRDPNNYPDPDTFDPQRFSEEGEESRHPMLFLPFGDGPRNCIGARFAIYQTKVGLMTILKNYRVDVCEKTTIPYVNHKSSFLLQPKDGIYLKFKKIILCLILTIIIFIYHYSTSTFTFWKNQGVNGPMPIPFVGNFKDFMLSRISIGDFAKKVYDEFENEKLIGFYARRRPILLLRDPNLIKDVLIKDFNKFADRGLTFHEKVDILSPNLFMIESKRWRPLRKCLSPVFTSGKLKKMFHLMAETCEHLEDYLNNVVVENEPIECRTLTAKFTTDVIGSCVFGIDINALSDEKNDFLRMGRVVFEVDFWRNVKFRMREVTPFLYNLLGPLVTEREMNQFFINLIRDAMQYREENNIVRHDFVDLLKQVKDDLNRLTDIEVTDTLIAAQAFVFFTAGFETSSTTMSNALYELALNPSIQDKLRREIQEELKITEGKLFYDRINNLKLLHMVFQETLRMYPPITVLMRKATENYTFTDYNVTLRKGDKVWIPIYGIHRDSKYHPNPDTFDPDRFKDEEVSTRHPMVFLPFGDGPRNCIGARFAVYQTKVGLMTILKNYRVDVCEKTTIPYVNHQSSFLLQPKDGIYLKFKKIQ
ncbi:probable cytochrome P450 6a14 [Leptopilina heterotoma]|uniref:probable cytochrome P450 6a14 n=1 Tax=Leptopilina heterotoma TaxID=63436 RepID=UPI001CA89888|nr:probable cytochrome P450 6a14 [Leptopilina heterotoma]